MVFLNEEAFFERRGERYVVRLTPFSAGYDLSKAQKELLFAGLQRLDLRTSIEAVVVFALIAGLFLSGVLRSETPVGWVLVFFTLTAVVLTVRSLRQRDRLLSRCVGTRPPDFPRLPFWTAMWKRRPLVAERFALPILRLAAVLLVLLLAGGNVLAAMPVIAAWRAGAPALEPNVQQIPSLTVYDDAFWLALLLFNLVVAAMIVALGIESRRLRRRRHRTPPGTTAT